MFRFIHAADTHIDSQLLGLASYEGAPVERLRSATRDAFANLVSLAIEEKVAFVIIAGDLFDGEWEDMRTGLWTAGQFRRLARENIPVFLVRGNHDAASKVRARMSWPKNEGGEEMVREFSVRSPQTFRIEDLGVALHGRGFAHQEAPDDLTVDYPEPIPGMFNIGVLHTSLSGDANHDAYAPVSEQALVNKGYDYWALGHIHKARMVRQTPQIAYPGNTQGRHAKETGAKGCLLVSVDDDRVAQTEFQPTDVLRWHRVEIPLGPEDGLAEIYERIGEELKACREAEEGRFSAVRLVIRGSCPAHNRLVRKGDRDEVIAQIRNLANDIDDVWVEKIELATSPAVNLDRLRKAGDLLGDLLRYIDRMSRVETELREIARTIEPLIEKAAHELKESKVPFDETDQLRQWLAQAEAILVARLTETAP
jgi:DNA repair protein SbcD/Mre11